MKTLSKKAFLFGAVALGIAASSSASELNSVGVITDFKSGFGYNFELPMNCALLAGNNNSGLIVAGGYQNRTIKRIESYATGNLLDIRDPGFPVKFLTGENRYGPIVVADDGYTIKYMDSYSNNTWKSIPTPPFKVEGIAGNNQTGIVIFNDGEIAYLSSYSGSWVKKRLFDDSTSPLYGEISSISGNNTAGIWIVRQNGYVYKLNKYSAVMEWVSFGNADYPFYGAEDVRYAGYPSNGLVMMPYSSTGFDFYSHYGLQGDRFRKLKGGPYGRVESGAMNLVGDPSDGVAVCTDSGVY
ncbi:hypothetical protein [Arsukibacterium perlucidum]|uniref:hypothetical protein n=1 Tax=Arsukibacterium perlucidum TaxID=368811 RepID=UPI00035E7522|nr:hypothetical protein [Arsukibacterium perlucidum]